jgi:predicted RNA binding protein YcfA (HicA-like mRNA interferase family)
MVTRQSGSHVRLTRRGEVEHHITIPLYHTLKVGTLHGILTNVAEHLGVTKEELVKSLWG